MNSAVQVPGTDKGNIMIYALSTCVWCRKTKAFLKDHGVAYSYLDVDLLEGEEKDLAVGELQKWNPLMSLPTVVINNASAIKGFNEEALQELVDR